MDGGAPPPLTRKVCRPHSRYRFEARGAATRRAGGPLLPGESASRAERPVRFARLVLGERELQRGQVLLTGAAAVAAGSGWRTSQGRCPRTRALTVSDCLLVMWALPRKRAVNRSRVAPRKRCGRLNVSLML